METLAPSAQYSKALDSTTIDFILMLRLYSPTTHVFSFSSVIFLL